MMTDNTNNNVDNLAQLPETFTYDSSDIDRLMTRPSLRDGIWCKFTVKEAKKGRSQKGNLNAVLTVAPVDENDIPRTPTVTVWVAQPFEITDAEKAQKTLDRAREYLRAVTPDLPRYPRYDKDTKTFMTDDGEALDSATATTKKREAIIAAMTMLQRRWADIGQYVGDTFYAQVRKDGDFTSLRYFRSAPPTDAEVVTSKFGA